MFETKKVMSTNVISVNRKTDIYEAIRLMVENNISGLPVVNDDMTLAGLVSEKDVLKLLYDPDKHMPDSKDAASPVENFMTESVTCFDKDEDLIAICECLIKNHFRRVPILDDGKLVGIISRKDIIKYIIEPIG